MINEKLVRGRRADCLYRRDASGILCASKIIPHNGMKLYEIKATYAKQLNDSVYYVLANDHIGAIAYFKDKYPWISVIRDVRKVRMRHEVDDILTDIYRMPIQCM